MKRALLVLLKSSLLVCILQRLLLKEINTPIFGGRLILALWSAHSFLGLGPAVAFPGYSVVHVSFCFPYTWLLGEVPFILCAVSQCAARAL